MRILVDAGVEVVGENRAQDLEAKHARYGDAFRWHFIGHLQSRKAKTVNAICELVPLARLGVGRAAKLDDPGARRGEPLRRADEVRGRARGARRVPRVYDDVRGLMTMPPATGDAETSRPYFRRLRELAAEHGLPELSMGTSQDYRVAVEEGATHIRVGSSLFGNRRPQ